MISGLKDGQPQETIDMKQTSSVKCEKCDNQTFKQTMILRKLSALLAPNGQETLIPVGVFACEKCGHVNSEFADINAFE